jgi:hypothetical protein
MVKKLKNQKSKTSQDTTKKTIDFSSVINQTNEKLTKQNKPDISLCGIQFNINPKGTDLEKTYHKKYISYLHEEFNFKIVKMFFNYISKTEIINLNVKDNRPFLTDFLKIITNLLMNEIDISAMAFLLEKKVKWLGQNETNLMWNHLYNVCLRAKQMTSDDFDDLINILDSQNQGFKINYDKWVKIKNCGEDLKIDEINSEYNDLIKFNYLNQSKSMFINYNEVVNKILDFSEKPNKEEKKTRRKDSKDINKDNINNDKLNNITLLNPSQIPPPQIQFDYYPQGALSLSPAGSNENFLLNNASYNNNYFSLSRNFFGYGNNNYFSNLNLVRGDSNRSYNSNFIDPNNPNN